MTSELNTDEADFAGGLGMFLINLRASSLGFGITAFWPTVSDPSFRFPEAVA